MSSTTSLGFRPPSGSATAESPSEQLYYMERAILKVLVAGKAEPHYVAVLPDDKNLGLTGNAEKALRFCFNPHSDLTHFELIVRAKSFYLRPIHSIYPISQNRIEDHAPGSVFTGSRTTRALVGAQIGKISQMLTISSLLITLYFSYAELTAVNCETLKSPVNRRGPLQIAMFRIGRDGQVTPLWRDCNTG